MKNQIPKLSKEQRKTVKVLISKIQIKINNLNDSLTELNTLAYKLGYENGKKQNKVGGK